jgi:hypothetical protein
VHDPSQENEPEQDRHDEMNASLQQPSLKKLAQSRHEKAAQRRKNIAT